MRFSDYDRTIHEYTITAGRGVELLGPAPAGAGLLTGLTQPYVDLPTPRPPDEPGSERVAKILIVDDEEPMRDLISLIFEEAGHRVDASP